MLLQRTLLASSLTHTISSLRAFAVSKTHEIAWIGCAQGSVPGDCQSSTAHGRRDCQSSAVHGRRGRQDPELPEVAGIVGSLELSGVARRAQSDRSRVFEQLHEKSGIIRDQVEVRLSSVTLHQRWGKAQGERERRRRTAEASPVDPGAQRNTLRTVAQRGELPWSRANARLKRLAFLTPNHVQA